MEDNEDSGRSRFDEEEFSENSRLSDDVSITIIQAYKICVNLF